MKATGIVRRIDDLGRVVIPKEIRRTLRIREGDPLEIYTDHDGEVIFKKYSPMGEFSNFAAQLCETLTKTISSPVLITDRDTVVSAAGSAKKELMDRHISDYLEKIMENRTVYQIKSEETQVPVCEDVEDRFIGIAAPIVCEGDVSGCVVFTWQEGMNFPGDTELKLAQTVSAFLSKQMES